MNTVTTNGALGSVILAAAIYAICVFFTRKSPWNLTNPIPDEWWEKRWIVAGVIVVVVLVAWLWPSQALSLQAPSLKTVWEGTKNYWHWIVLVLVILFFLPSVFAKPWLKPLPWLAVITAVMLWGVFPVLVGIQGDGTSSQHQRSEIPLASSPQSSWPKLSVPAGGKSEVIPLPPGMRVIWAGYKFRNYTVYPDGHECAFNGTTPCPNGGTGTYANNETNVVNVVAYAFAPI